MGRIYVHILIPQFTPCEWTRSMLLLIVFIIFFKPTNAQNQYRFNRYNVKDGLAYEETRGIIQDSLGFIWTIHPDGLSRFDGYEFKVYKYEPDDPARNGLNILLSGLWQSQSGDLFIGGSSHFLKYDPFTDGFISLPPIPVYHVWQDFLFDPDESKIWLCTFQQGLFLVEGEERKVTNYLNAHDDPELEKRQNDMNGSLDMGTTLLIASLNGLWQFDKNTRKFERPKVALKDTVLLYNSYCIRLIKQRDGTIWLHRIEVLKTDHLGRAIPLSNVTGLKSEFVKLDSDLRVLKRIPLPESLVFNSCAINDDIIWLGNQGQGLYRINTNDSSLEQIKHNPSDQYTIPSNVIKNIFIDREKNVWICTSKGISVLQNKGIKFNNSKLSDGLIDGSQIHQIRNKEFLLLSKRTSPVRTPDNINTILISQIGNGWRDNLEFSQVMPPIKGYSIEKFEHGQRNLWLTVPGIGIVGYPIDQQTGAIQSTPTQSMGHDPKNKNTIGNRLVSDILEDNDSTLWVANKRTGIDRINTAFRYGAYGSVTNYKHLRTDSNSIQEDRVYDLFPEDKSSIWVLTETGLDLLVKNGSDNEPLFRHMLIDRDPPLIMERTKGGTLLLGTTRGLYEVHKVDDKYSFELIWNKSGVSDVQEDQQGRLWIYGSNLLGLLDRNKRIQIEFNKDEGIDHTASFNSGHMHQAHDGTIMLVDPDGISTFDPLTLQISKNIVRPLLTNLRVNNHSFWGNHYLGTTDFTIPCDIRVLNDLSIDYRHNNFSLEFSAMEMTSPERNLYRHKLEGYDPDWIESDYKNRIATYTNLPAGDYVFKVKASNHHGIWSDHERILHVKILPPPWRTWWAYTGYGLLAFGLLYWARSNIVQRERLKSKLKLEQLEHEKEHFELEKAKEIDKVKTSFFTNISHEFRTPLTLIKGPVQDILEQYKDDPKLHGRLKLIERNSDLLLKLINQLLDLAKLEAGTMKIEKSKSDVISFINAISSSFQSFAMQKQVALHLELPPVHYEASFDKDKLETILFNLINNAIKFTPAGGSVTIVAVISSLASGTIQNGSSDQCPVTSNLRLIVRDTGIGIPPEHQSKIFERFHQVSEAHQQVGTGVGLALVKEIVSLLGGCIDVNSEPGQGTEFVVTLPVEVVESEKLKVVSDEVPVTLNNDIPVSQRHSKTGTPETSTTPGFENLSLTNTQTHDDNTKPHVLVVEDNHDLRAFIIDCLGDEFNFLEAENGKKGLTLAADEIPDMIISDVMMPEMDGITMVEKIKKDFRTCHIPLILLTAKSTEDSKLQGLQSGADDYLTKPFNKQELLLKVRNGVNRQLKLRERLRADLMSTVPKVEVLSADEQFLNKVKEGIMARLSDEQLSVESLAEDMSMSRVQLYRKITALTGLSSNELIRKLRLQKAAQLLQQKWGPVSQVAYEVGFSNLSYFSKVFKEEFGLLPSEYNVKVNY